MASATAPQPIFYYDLGSPSCYLAAEAVMTALPVVPEWEPVLGASLSLQETDPERQLIEERASAQELLPLRWPTRWPPEARRAALAATYAKQIGRAVAFSLACFRQAFAGGRDLGDDHTVLIAAAACEMHPTAVLRGIELRSVAEGLEAACDRLRRTAARTLPAIQVGDQVFEGDDALQQAASALGAIA